MERPLIIVADDDRNDRFLIIHALKDAQVSLEVQEVSDGEELIEFMETKCQDIKPKFILLDLNMPRKSGFEVLEYLKYTNTEICKVPVIVLSTSSSKKDILRAKELGATDYIVKPVDYPGYLGVAHSLNRFLE